MSNTGTAGDDVFWGNTGSESISGGGGWDVLDYATLPDGYTTSARITALGSGIVEKRQAGVLVGTDTISGITMLSDGDGNDLYDLSGPLGTPSIAAPLMVIMPRAGNDTIDAGNHASVEVDYIWSQTGVAVALQTGIDAAGNRTGIARDGFGGIDTLVNVLRVRGSTHSDRLTGGDGDDTFATSAGDDTLLGGGGSNTLDYAAPHYPAGYRDPMVAAVTVTLTDTGAGTTAKRDGGTVLGTDNFAGFGTILGSALADSITGYAYTTRLQVLEGMAGADTIDGGGNFFNLVDYAHSAAGVVINLGAGLAADGWGSLDVLRNVLHVRGSAFNDIVKGHAYNSEIFEASLGNDTYAGNGGTDTLTYAGLAGRSVTVTMTGNDSGTAVKDAGGGTDSFSGVSIIEGSAGADSITGFAGTTRMTLLRGMGGDDTIDGGGNKLNVLEYVNSTAGVGIDLSTGLATDGLGGTDHLRNIAALQGSAFSDTVTGGTAAEIFYASAGNDSYVGGGGSDALSYVRYGVGKVVVSFDAGGNGTALKGEGGAQGQDSFTGIEAIAGTNATDVLNGHVTSLPGGSLYLDGRGSNDILFGYGVADNVADYLSRSGAVVATLGRSGSASLAGGEVDTLIDIVAIRGTAQADRFTGSAADELFIGSGGNDSVAGGAGFDTLDYSQSAKAVTVAWTGADAGTAAKGTSGGVDSFTGIERIVGSALADRITGNAAVAATTYVFGGQGSDTIDSGGNTHFVADYQGGAAIVADLGWGKVQEAYASPSTDMLIGVVQLRGSDEADSIAGNTSAETLLGGGGNDTISGGDGADSLDGGSGNDLLYGGDGDDAISGGDGNDTLYSEHGRDTLDGGNGNDALYGGGVSLGGLLDGGAGADTLAGSEGDDTLLGGSGADAVYGNAGNDSVEGGDGDDYIDAGIGSYGKDTVDGGLGKDLIFGGEGDDSLLGGGGDDTLWGGAGNDSLSGNEGSDVLFAAEGDDALSGGEGEDTLCGDDGDDTLSGDQGNDLLRGNAGNDLLMGGAGSDTLEGADGNDTLDGGGGMDSLDGGLGDDLLHGIDGDSTLLGRDGNDTVVAEAGNSRLDGGAGDDYVLAFGNSTLLGGDGNDTLEAHSGDGSLYGGNSSLYGGGSSLDGGAGNDSIFASGNNTLLGGDGNDTINSDGPIAYLDGGAGNDLLRAYGDSIVLLGGDGDDTLRAVTGGEGSASVDGGAGNDDIAGYDGSDILDGGDGNDTLAGWAGNDTLDGGAGHDTAVFSGTRADTTLTRNADGSWTATGPDGTDILRGIEILRFDDATVALNRPERDFDGDGYSDILFDNPAVDYLGTSYRVLAKWHVDGASFKSGGNFASTDPAWSVAGTGDFNGDGKADLLWHQADGTAAIWLLNNGEFKAGTTIYAPAAGEAYDIAGIADFNGDGKSDILFSRQVQDNLGHAFTKYSLWQMDGLAGAGGGSIATVDAAWSLAGVADFDGDGRADILWQNADNSVSIWRMNGTSYIDGGTIGAADPGWTIAGTGDLNGDGRSDLVWRHTDGSVAAWLTDGTKVTASATLYNPGADWKIAGIGDYDGDGMSDLLWRHDPVPGYGTTEAQVWSMNGLQVTKAATLAYVDNAWQVV